jgi:hypothetical protein
MRLLRIALLLLAAGLAGCDRYPVTLPTDSGVCNGGYIPGPGETYPWPTCFQH